MMPPGSTENPLALSCPFSTTSTGFFAGTIAERVGHDTLVSGVDHLPVVLDLEAASSQRIRLHENRVRHHMPRVVAGRLPCHSWVWPMTSSTCL